MEVSLGLWYCVDDSVNLLLVAFRSVLLLDDGEFVVEFAAEEDK